MMTDTAARDARLDSQDPGAFARSWVERARVEGPSALLALFSDRLLWSRAPSWLQDQALAALASALGSEYEAAPARVYACGGQSHRIGAVIHVRTGAVLHALPGGECVIGVSPEDDQQAFLDEGSPTLVRLAPMLIGATPVTQAHWDTLGGTDSRRWRGESLPIDSVSWHSARSWLKRAGGGLRLPSESEWEYACRAGTTSRFYWGDKFDPRYCCYADNSDMRTRQVGLSPSNAFGLFDMVGNVFEWCEDVWRDSHIGIDVTGKPRTAGDGAGPWRVLRGGSWEDAAHWMRSTIRLEDDPSHEFTFEGFRVARSFPRD